MIRLPPFPSARLRSFAALLPLLGVGCHAPPPPATPPAPAPPATSASVTAATAPLAPSRWLELGATTIGPKRPEGTLLLLGGRRALVAANGTVTAEPAPVADPLRGLLEVPAADGRSHLVGYSRRAVYRLDGPLGELKTLLYTEGDNELSGVAVGPGSLVVWDVASEKPMFLDVGTGAPLALPSWPVLPIREIAFANAKEGACVFEAAGLQATIDGGATWRPVRRAHGAAAQDRVGDLSMWFYNLRVVSGKVVLELGSRAHPIDLASGTVDLSEIGPPRERILESLPESRERRAEGPIESPVLEWIRRTGTDPLLEAVTNGVLLSPNEALVVREALVARVDLTNGLILQADGLPHVPGGSAVASCESSGDAVWISYPFPEEPPGGDPMFRLHSLPLGGGAMKPFGAPVLQTRRPGGSANVEATQGGGVMLAASCDPLGNPSAVCVRQPNGTWKTLYPKRVAGSGIEPLSSGAVAYVRGLSVAEDLPDDLRLSEEDQDAGAPENSKPSKVSDRRSYLVTMDGCGLEKTAGILRWPSAEPLAINVRSGVWEGPERQLHVMLQPAHGDPSVFIVKPGDKPVEVSPIVLSGAVTAGLHGRFGVAVGGKGGLRESADGGATWAEMKGVPRGVRESLDRLQKDRVERTVQTMYSDYVGFGVSEVGFRLNQFVRLGWGPPGPPPGDRPSGGVSIRPPPLSETSIVCSKGEATSGTRLLDEGVLADSFPASPKNEPGRFMFDGKRGALGRVGLLATQWGTRAPKWTFSWFDPTEKGASPGRVTFPAPPELGWDVALASVATSGKMALFMVRGPYGSSVLRTSGKGVVIKPLPERMSFLGDVVFGATESEPIIWSARSYERMGWQIFLWKAGDQPRVVASAKGPAPLALGRLTKDGIPVTLITRRSAAKKILKVPSSWPAVAPNIGMDGWTRLPLSASTLGRLPSCAKDPGGGRGERVIVPVENEGSVTIDGASVKVLEAEYDLRIHGDEICIAGISATWSTAWRSDTPTDLLRWDMLTDRAELVSDEPRDPVRKMTCEIRARSGP